jgi:hypothetical protein
VHRYPVSFHEPVSVLPVQYLSRSCSPLSASGKAARAAGESEIIKIYKFQDLPSDMQRRQDRSGKGVQYSIFFFGLPLIEITLVIE